MMLKVNFFLLFISLTGMNASCVYSSKFDDLDIMNKSQLEKKISEAIRALDEIFNVDPDLIVAFNKNVVSRRTLPHAPYASLVFLEGEIERFSKEVPSPLSEKATAWARCFREALPNLERLFFNVQHEKERVLKDK